MNRILLQNIYIFGGVLIFRLMSVFFFVLFFVFKLDVGVFWKIKKIILCIDVYYMVCVFKEVGKNGQRMIWDGFIYGVWVLVCGFFLFFG